MSCGASSAALSMTWPLVPVGSAWQSTHLSGPSTAVFMKNCRPRSALGCPTGASGKVRSRFWYGLGG